MALASYLGHKMLAKTITSIFVLCLCTNQLGKFLEQSFPLLIDVDVNDFDVRRQSGSKICCQQLCKVPSLRIFSLVFQPDKFRNLALPL